MRHRAGRGLTAVTLLRMMRWHQFFMHRRRRSHAHIVQILLPRRLQRLMLSLLMVNVVRVMVLGRQCLMLWPVLALHSFFFCAQLCAVVLLLTSTLLKLLKDVSILRIACDSIRLHRHVVCILVRVGSVRHGHVDVWVLRVHCLILLLRL